MLGTMERASIRAGGTDDQRRPVVLIEDDRADLSPIDKSTILAAGFDLVICSGPSSVHEECPLVMDGACPAGRPDVVVCDLQGDWRPSVEAAWRLDGVPVTSTDQGTGHTGAAMLALFRSLWGDEIVT